MGLFQDYIRGAAMAKNPALLKRRMENMDAADMKATIDEMYGQQAQAQETAPYALDDAEQFPGEAPIQGLMDITQEEQAGTGLIGSAGSPEEQRYLQAQKVLGMSGNRQGLGQQTDLLKNMQNSVMANSAPNRKSKGSWSTFEIGAGDGKKQRAYFDESGTMVPVGEPYRAFSPNAPSAFSEKMSALGSEDPAVKSRALQALRSQWRQTDIGDVNTATGQFVDKNIIEGKVQKGYGESISQKLEGYNDYTKQSAVNEYELDRTMTDLDSLFDMTSNWTTGVGGTLLSYIPQTEATDWDAAKTTVISQLGLEKLKDLKASSPTGASGFGALSEKELKLLTSYVSNLEQAQSPAAIRKSIRRVQKHLETVKGNVLDDRKRSDRWFKTNSRNQDQNRGGRYKQDTGPREGVNWK